MKKFRNKALSTILSAAMLVSMAVGTGGITASAATQWDGTADISWYNSSLTKSSLTNFTITTAADLAGLAEIVNRGTDDFTGKTVTVEAGAAINLAGNDWTPIGKSFNEFNGTFDGKNGTISGLTIGTSDDPDSTTTYVGLFGYIGSTGTVENVCLVGTSIYSSLKDDNVGGLVGYNWGNIGAGCYVTGSSATCGSNAYVGGLEGYGDTGTIANSYSNCDVIGGIGASIGGFAGQSYSDISNVYATGYVSQTTLTDATSHVGGLVGYYNDGTTIGCGNGIGTTTSMISTDMKSSVFAATLNTNKGSNSGWATWVYTLGVNSGFPILSGLSVKLATPILTGIALYKNSVYIAKNAR